MFKKTKYTSSKTWRDGKKKRNAIAHKKYLVASRKEAQTQANKRKELNNV